MPPVQLPRFLRSGDTALVVEFGASVDRTISALVLSLAGLIEAEAIPGVVEGENPRLRVPSGSIAIAMAMTTVYSLESPGGWHLLGRTPVLMWDPRRAEPTLLAAGDKVMFTPVSRREYESILAQSKAGTFDLRPDAEARA
jgi:allophanate hydrolase subunit 1